MSGAPPLDAGRRVAALFARSAPRMFADLVDAGVVPALASARHRARAEWDCFAFFGCGRGVGAGSGFAPAPRRTI